MSKQLPTFEVYVQATANDSTFAIVFSDPVGKRASMDSYSYQDAELMYNNENHSHSDWFNYANAGIVDKKLYDALKKGIPEFGKHHMLWMNYNRLHVNLRFESNYSVTRKMVNNLEATLKRFMAGVCLAYLLTEVNKKKGLAI